MGNKEPRSIVLHCSDSDSSFLDNISEIRKIHIEQRKFRDVGYHFFIRKNGAIEKGRGENEEGAHTKGFNLDTEDRVTIGICLHGKKYFNTGQFIALAMLINDLRKRYDIPRTSIYPHWFFNEYKTCPNFDLSTFWEIHDEIYRGKK